MLEILKTAFGRLVNSQKRPRSDAPAEEGSYWENELALFAPMEFLPAGQRRRTSLEPKAPATIHPPEPKECSSAAPSHKLVEPV
jgi:hypothetical protein